MQTLTVEITNEHALKVIQDLQEKHFINILSRPDFGSLVFPGQPLTDKEFKDFIASREKEETISLKQAKVSWAKKRKQLLDLTK